VLLCNISLIWFIIINRDNQERQHNQGFSIHRIANFQARKSRSSKYYEGDSEEEEPDENFDSYLAFDSRLKMVEKIDHTHSKKSLAMMGNGSMGKEAYIGNMLNKQTTTAVSGNSKTLTKDKNK